MNASRMTIHAALWINASGLAAVLAVNTPTVVLASVPHPGTTARAHVKTSDSRIKAQVEAALASDTRLRGSNVLVQSANDGVVVLAGTAKTMSDHLHATGDAARVRGVHRVANEVKIQALLGDEESRGEQRPHETDRSYATPDFVRDTWTASATEARKLADSPTPGLGLVNVDTRNGAVRLFGAEPPVRGEAAAEENGPKISKVKRLVRGGRLVARSEHEAVKARDQDLERAVREALKDRLELTVASIDVDVKHGVARLTGTVPTQGQRRTAALTARSVAGVMSVRDALRVSSR